MAIQSCPVEWSVATDVSVVYERRCALVCACGVGVILLWREKEGEQVLDDFKVPVGRWPVEQARLGAKSLFVYIDGGCEDG
jgi:hypothetical protein